MDASPRPAIPGALQPEGIPFVPTKTPSPYSMATSMPSLAARKAALFEKFGAKSTSPTAVSPKHLPTPSFSQPDWTKTLAGDTPVRERKDTLASTYSVASKLSPMPTGSTVASTAVDPTTLPAGTPEPLRQVPSFASVGNRVRLAVMTLNAIEKSRDGPMTWRVGGAGDEVAGSGSDRRSWSRMSGATKVGDLDGSLPTEGSKSFLAEEMTFNESTSPSAESPDTALAPSKTAGIFDESFDTHPPDMVSPRTGLAYVILPRWARRQSAIEEEDAASTPSGMNFPTRLTEAEEEEDQEEEIAEVSRSSTPEPVSDVEPQALPLSSPPSTTPSHTPSASPIPLARENQPVVLRGQGMPSHSTSSSHTRSASVSQPPPLRERMRCSSTLPPRRPVQPTQFWKIPERLRRPSSVLPPIPQEPLMVKPLNKYPLRKVQTPASKAMRFSMAL